MYLTLNKSLPLFFVFCGTMITLSSSSWLMAWAGLEVNMMAFIPIILTNNKLSNESALKYFFIQASGSIMIFLSTIMMMNNTLTTSMDFSNLLTKTLIPLALMLKLGAAPMHFWFPQVMEGLNWPSSIMLLTWQKIAPLFLMTTYNLMNPLLYLVIISSAITGAVGGLNQLLLRKILAYSSINHLAWMIMSSLISMNILLTYFIIYSLVTMTIILLLMSNNLIHLSQLMSNHYSLSLIPVALFLNLLSLGGMPPFLGFFPKWVVLTSLASSSLFFLSILLVMCSILTLYFYMRISFNLLMMAPKLSWFNKSLMSLSWPMKLMSMTPIITLPFMIMM
uniref:NADH-ubiquinone oxidoreductase chain 2 n=1 Tax=Macrolenostreptus orestes TaxID=2931673 RepID=A0A8T9JAP2_9MYRI|nr:NADH dehydrogenase subunit 2 [Macrolenostreptus orestes]UOF70309.1 NADH dehydrogenase subunit 2 [Macrolenostreptus orestes]